MTRRAALVAAALTAAKLQGVHAMLNCSQESDHPVVSSCCSAMHAYEKLAEDGGCGGGQSEEQSKKCTAGQRLCHECQGAVAEAARLEHTSLDIDFASLEIRCELPQWRATECTGSVTGVGFGLLIGAGFLLLTGAALALMCFDWRLLPKVVARHRRKLLVEAIEARPKDDGDSCNASGPAPPQPVPPAPPTPRAKPPESSLGHGLDSLRLAAAAAEAAQYAGQSPCAARTPELMSPAMSPCSIVAGSPDSIKELAEVKSLPSMSSSGKPTTSKRWPRRFASAYALHKSFMTIASVAVVLRVTYIAGRMLLVLDVHLAQEWLPELLLSMLPLVWVACTSRRPRSSTAAVPVSVAYWGPFQRALPRFTTFAVLTVCTELYSTVAAALAVANSPCTASPWRGALLYCIGLLVAVARAYSAVLAVRLQDELGAVCRKVRPARQDGDAPQTPKTPKTPGAGDHDVLDDSHCTLESFVVQAEKPVRLQLSAVTTDPSVPSQASPSSPTAKSCHISCGLCRLFGGSCGSRCQKPPDDEEAIVEDQVRDFNDPEPEDLSKASLACAFLPEYCFPALRRRRIAGRRLLAGGIVLALLSAVASAVVVRSIMGEQTPPVEEPPNSCTVAQNGTSTCTAWQLAGTNLTDSETGEKKMDLVTTMEGCCQGCNDIDDCQAWIFDGIGGRCRWIHFLDEVCNDNPGDLSCRCYTHWATQFGFKPPPETKLIYKKSDTQARLRRLRAA
eukprot:TRINITY_DN41193_c0_g1_i1.p1 TRINITY_DN41193_c0_g1~~TRINITY_DN41193_c0_g1_i1.p1  ORF type:complete len:733 (+),score=137.33 TRINITY_DN41193_c0_g1_i1:35-2233(+)